MASSTSALADRLVEMIEVPSTTGQEAAYADLVAGYLAEQGFATRRQPVAPGRDNLIAGERPEVLFSTHLDTVPPHLPPRRDGATILGRGACDTKGCLAAMLEATARLEPDLRRRVGYLLVVGEEVDHCGAIRAASLDLRPRGVLLGEPTGNRFATTQKGILRLTLRAGGVAGHSGYPELGPSAVHRLIEVLAALLAVDWPVDPARGATTLNVGRIEGGAAGNVIAPAASAELVFRTVGDPADLLAEVDRRLGEGLTREVATSQGPLDLPALDGFETTVVSFHTDAAYLSGLGPIHLVGPGDIRVAHSGDERIDLAELEAGADVYERAARLLLEVPCDS